MNHKYKFKIVCNSKLQADDYAHRLIFFYRKPEYAFVDRENNTITIETSHYYCIVCNILLEAKRKNLLKANKEALNWLENYPR